MASKNMLTSFVVGTILAFSTSAHAATSASVASQISPYRALTGVIIRSRCHMNECEWFRIGQSTLVRNSGQKSMFEIKVSYWSSDYPDGNYDTVRPRDFLNSATPYIVCSKTDASIIEQEDGPQWTQSQLAPGAKDQIFGYLESALAIYWAACHKMNIRDVYAATAIANKLGYPRAISSDRLTQRNLTAPLDGFSDQ